MISKQQEAKHHCGLFDGSVFSYKCYQIVCLFLGTGKPSGMKIQEIPSLLYHPRGHWGHHLLRIRVPKFEYIQVKHSAIPSEAIGESCEVNYCAELISERIEWWNALSEDSKSRKQATEHIEISSEERNEVIAAKHSGKAIDDWGAENSKQRDA
jgi:hypothetical protein